MDRDFCNEYKLEMVAGHALDSETSPELAGDVWIVNEAAVESFGWESAEIALTKHIGNETNKIIGVVKNFHFRGLQESIAPLAFFYMVEDYRYLTLTISTNQIDETIAFIDETHKRLFPGKIYQHFFLDKDFEQQYMAEERISKIITVFTFLGILIACLGLFGLASFIAEQRTKEIGIRKVMGASVAKIIVLLSAEFIKWVLWACLIAIPIAWYATNLWLENFAYRIDVGYWVFVYSSVLALLIALFTVSWQSVKAAYSNPVEALRYE